VSALAGISDSALLAVIFLSLMIVRFRLRAYSNIITAWVLAFPFVGLHEMAHAIIGLLLNARPVAASLFPQRTEDGRYAMGSVSFQNCRWYNAMLTGLAPLLLLVPFFYADALWQRFLPVGMAGTVLALAVKVFLVDNSIPSTTDFDVAFSKGFGLIIYILVVVAVLHAFLRYF
jgi:hypothetical protein